MELLLLLSNITTALHKAQTGPYIFSESGPLSQDIEYGPH
jgi:hypothetical protein